ncbi:MAG TPA: OmpA family protein [Opitutaceae bacterium]|nr:OmpA family protein [Opitutaceae bacterium]
MNLVAKNFSLALAGFALLLAGCTHAPTRPTPDQTRMGPQTGGDTINPNSVATGFNDLGLPARNPSDMAGSADGRGILAPVYFEFNESSIKPAERAKLQEAAKYLKEHADVRLLLEGHCDWRGTAEYNLGLGDRRANAAKKYLGTIGVAADRLETLSKGSLEAAKEADDATMQKDRRVELVILKK